MKPTRPCSVLQCASMKILPIFFHFFCLNKADSCSSYPYLNFFSVVSGPVRGSPSLCRSKPIPIAIEGCLPSQQSLLGPPSSVLLRHRCLSPNDSMPIGHCHGFPIHIKPDSHKSPSALIVAQRLARSTGRSFVYT